jgi:D-alanyl-D-alanine carboxypeptidase
VVDDEGMRIGARTLTVLAVLLLAGCGTARQEQRPAFQRTLDELVTGSQRAAPGVTAFVSGPRGTWAGASGWAGVATHERMAAADPLRLESVSKLWTSVVVLKLAEEGRLRLDDTVERWLPGFFPYGSRITIRQLLNHTSGMINDGDWNDSGRRWIAAVEDPALRARLVELATQLERDPTTQFSPLLEMRFAAALPLLFAPGSTFHYSNVGYITAGVIAAKAAGESLDALYRRVIIEPLHLTSALYAPGDHWPGEHPTGYSVGAGGKLVEATHWSSGGLAAQGAIVSSARDEAHFLTELMRGRVLNRASLRQLRTPNSVDGVYALGIGRNSACGQTTYAHNGGGPAFSSSVAVSEDGSRVAVILANGRTADTTSDARYAAAVLSLFCAA